MESNIYARVNRIECNKIYVIGAVDWSKMNNNNNNAFALMISITRKKKYLKDIF